MTESDSEAVQRPADKDREIELLRAVYEAARRVLRFNGIDRLRVEEAVCEMDMAIEAVKTLDAGYDGFDE